MSRSTIVGLAIDTTLLRGRFGDYEVPAGPVLDLVPIKIAFPVEEPFTPEEMETRSATALLRQLAVQALARVRADLAGSHWEWEFVEESIYLNDPGNQLVIRAHLRLVREQA